MSRRPCFAPTKATQEPIRLRILEGRHGTHDDTQIYAAGARRAARGLQPYAGATASRRSGGHDRCQRQSDPPAPPCLRAPRLGHAVRRRGTARRGGATTCAYTCGETRTPSRARPGRRLGATASAGRCASPGAPAGATAGSGSCGTRSRHRRGTASPSAARASRRCPATTRTASSSATGFSTPARRARAPAGPFHHPERPVEACTATGDRRRIPDGHRHEGRKGRRRFRRPAGGAL